MSIYKLFKTDKNLEQDGVWIEYPENEDGSIPSFKIARMSRSNKNYLKAVEEKTKPYKRQIELNAMKSDLADDMLLDIFVSAILLDWKNVVTLQGNAFPYSKENAKQLMKMLHDLYDDLQEKAKEIQFFIDRDMENDAKN